MIRKGTISREVVNTEGAAVGIAFLFTSFDSLDTDICVQILNGAFSLGRPCMLNSQEK